MAKEKMFSSGRRKLTIASTCYCCRTALPWAMWLHRVPTKSLGRAGENRRRRTSGQKMDGRVRVVVASNLFINFFWKTNIL